VTARLLEREQIRRERLVWREMFVNCGVTYSEPGTCKSMVMYFFSFHLTIEVLL
jgi:hypothetical protein